MANDIVDFDEKQEMVMKIELEIHRMETALKENEFKIFTYNKEIRRLQKSIEISRKAIEDKKLELRNLEA